MIERYSYALPRSLVMPSFVPSKVCAAKLPSARITRGWTVSSCAIRKGLHAATSSGSGLRFFSGRHLTTFAM